MAISTDNGHDKTMQKWKYLSFALIGILAVAPTTAFVAPQAYADTLTTIQSIVTDIQSKVNSGTFGLQAIKSAVDTKATQSSVNNLQTSANNIKTDTQIIRGDLYSFKTTAEPKLNTIQTTTNNIDTKVTDIQTKVTALSSSSAGGGSGFKIIRNSLRAPENAAAGPADLVTCNSNSDYTLSVLAIKPLGGFTNTQTLAIYTPAAITPISLTDSLYFSMGASAGEETAISINSGSSNLVFGAIVTLETASGATASCILS